MTDPWRKLHAPNEGATNEWYTPPHVFEALGVEFSLDPCSPPEGVPWIPVKTWMSEADDGLSQRWFGRVWMNPPYGRVTGKWMHKLRDHGNGIALVFARTDVKWWHETVRDADAVCLVAGRLTFVPGDGQKAPGNSGAPSALVAYGADNAEAVAQSGLGMTLVHKSSEESTSVA
ncbi:DNA N-6-adenine-methyltransferase [Candidatus Solirubrobacter pratensis]|uniref:DNA N-6-adenine-methyltransferase n=1 Tax=Candidatus Solirubrobacter pratensis TaxID=1298857 RepID=UPI0009DB9AC1|nr:DNA N-6-adenine-methyltransferase [Candidatus Solirubrobacter pratensis]